MQKSFSPEVFNLAADRARQLRMGAVTLPSLALHLSERKIMLMVGDLLCLNGALLLSLWQRPLMQWSLTTLWNQLPWFVLLSTIWLLVSPLFQSYDLAMATKFSGAVISSSTAALATLLLWLLVRGWLIQPPAQPAEIVWLMSFGVAGILAWRLLYALVMRQPAFMQNAIVIGAGAAGHMLASTVATLNAEKQQVGYRLLGFIDDDPGKLGQRIDGIPVLGAYADLQEIVARLNPHQLILAITNTHTMQPLLFSALLDCYETGVPVTTMPTIYEQLTGCVPVEHAGRNLEVVLPLKVSGTRRLYLSLRHLLDRLIGLVGSLGLLGLIPFVWLANRRYAPGPLFYTQERVGKGGKPFAILKFRTMIVNAETNSGAQWAEEDDPRITKVGHWLRKVRLDELPQFWNMAKGEMSLIGPRPERPIFVEQLNQAIPFYQTRHVIYPGLTGWAQVEYRYGASVEDALVKLRYDLYYIKHQGPLLDLEILLKTVGVVLGLKGR